MAKKQPGESEKSLRGFFEFAIKIWEDGTRLKEIRKDLGLSKKAFAKKVGISVNKLDRYERPGQMAGNFWLFCHDLRHVDIRDPDD